MPTSLPNTASLLSGLLALERQLVQLERTYRGQSYSAQSADGKVRAVADGLGRLTAVTLDPSLLTSTPVALATQVKGIVNQALTAAYTATSTAIGNAAKTLAVPGLPAQGQSPPGYTGFSAVASALSAKIIAANPCNTTTVFECISGVVTARLNGKRQIVELIFRAPLPTFAPELEDAIVDAINCAIGKATDRDADTPGAVGPISGTAATFTELVLYSSDEMDIELHATVKDAAGTGFGKIGNAGTDKVKLWSGAETGDIISRGQVWLDPGSRVHGSVRTASNVVKLLGAVVDGTTTENAVVVLPDLQLNVAFPSQTQGSIDVLIGQQRSAAPGYYNKIHVFPSGRLTLRSGVYFCNELLLDLGSVLAIDAVSGPVYIYVKNVLLYAGAVIDAASGGFPSVFFGYVGILPLVINKPFAGTLAAPNAKVSLFNVVGVDHVGAVHAKEVELESHAAIRHRPFPVPYELFPGLVAP